MKLNSHCESPDQALPFPPFPPLEKVGNPLAWLEKEEKEEEEEEGGGKEWMEPVYPSVSWLTPSLSFFSGCVEVPLPADSR